MNTCENCYWYDPFFADYGFCDEREEYVKEHGTCPKWKEREDDNR